VYTSVETLLPYLYQERINESGYHRKSNVYFDHDSGYVSYDDTLRIDIAQGTRDLLSFWYYLRQIPLEIGDTIVLSVHNSHENHEISCLVRGQEEVETGAGTYNTIVVEPRTEGKGIFGAKGGMVIWYSETERLPVQIKARMKFGSVLFKLQEVRY
jgi:hypothetical protein